LFGREDPIDTYFSGNFKSWQEHQNQKNFEREYIVSLIKLSEANKWLYVGCFASLGSEPVLPKGFLYQTKELIEFSEFTGRLIVDFERTGRQSYLLAENWESRISVLEIKEEKLSISDFPGFKKVDITKADLDLIVSSDISSWRSALSIVALIYLITDRKNGMLYVGKASGSVGIWQRWCEYSHTSHGGNVELKLIMKEKGKDYFQNFSYSIIEILDVNTSEGEILDRESHWKRVLSSIDHGYNRN
jgi:hypothetical protein